jgi:hypothetical protein
LSLALLALFLFPATHLTHDVDVELFQQSLSAFNLRSVLSRWILGYLTTICKFSIHLDQYRTTSSRAFDIQVDLQRTSLISGHRPFQQSKHS